MAITKTSIETLEKIKRKLPISLPNHPTKAGYSPDQLKKFFGSMAILDEEDSVVSEFNRIVDEVNENCQQKLTPGEGITIDENNVISASSGIPYYESKYESGVVYNALMAYKDNDRANNIFYLDMILLVRIYLDPENSDRVLNVDISDMRSGVELHYVGNAIDLNSLPTNEYLESNTTFYEMLQPKLTAGEGITLDENNVINVDNNVIKSAAKDISINEIRQVFTEGYGSEGLSNKYTFAKSVNTSNGRQRACAYGNGYFVIVGASGQIEYSTNNGKNWTAISKFTTGTLTGIAYGNGIFVVVDYESKSIWSTDIPTNKWKKIYTFTDSELEGCRYVNNEFVVVGTNGLIAKSYDAENWYVVYEEEGITFYDVAYGNGKYVVSGSAGITMYSYNSATWYKNHIPGLETDIRHIIYANDNFVIGSSGGRIDWSKNGLSWYRANNPSTLSISWIRGFAYGDNRLYACMYSSNGKGEIWFSKDKGETWSIALSLSGVTRLWCICFANDTFISGGENGIIYNLNLEITWSTTNPQTEYIYQKQLIISNDGSVVESDVNTIIHKIESIDNIDLLAILD